MTKLLFHFTAKILQQPVVYILVVRSVETYVTRIKKNKLTAAILYIYFYITLR